MITKLTPRHIEVIECLAEGMSNRQIAEHLNIAHDTVKSHLYHISTLLGTNNRTQTVVYAFRKGILKTDIDIDRESAVYERIATTLEQKALRLHERSERRVTLLEVARSARAQIKTTNKEEVPQ